MQQALRESVRRSYLHATEADPDGSRCALLAFPNLIGLLLLRSVVPMLASAHLQVQHTRYSVAPGQVLQQDEFWDRVKAQLTTADLTFLYFLYISVHLDI